MQRIILFAGAAILVLMWVFPPWLHYFSIPPPWVEKPRTQRGYFFVADTQQGEPAYPNLIMRIDFGRLLAQSVAVSLITAVAFFALRPNK
jgi:hypothetical protein